MAEAVKAGVESAGGTVGIHQCVPVSASRCITSRLTRLLYPRIAETLSDEVLAKMHAPPKPNYPIFAPHDLTNYDALIFGIPTRYGSFPAQWKVRL